MVTVLTLKLCFQDYFTNRQDRYVVVEDCPKLANYFDNLAQEISDFSFKVVYKPGGEKKTDNFQFVMSENWSGGHPYKGNFDKFIAEANKKLKNFLSRQMADNYVGFEQGSFVTKSDTNNKECDTWIFPSIQMGTMGINQDSEITTRYLNGAIDKSKCSVNWGTTSLVLRSCGFWYSNVFLFLIGQYSDPHCILMRGTYICPVLERPVLKW